MWKSNGRSKFMKNGMPDIELTVLKLVTYSPHLNNQFPAAVVDHLQSHYRYYYATKHLLHHSLVSASFLKSIKSKTKQIIQLTRSPFIRIQNASYRFAVTH